MGGRLVMDEEQLFLFEEIPPDPEIIPDPELCPFCGGKPHINWKILWEKKYGWPRKPLVRRSVYVYCGRCRARGPIVAKTMNHTILINEDSMIVEAIRKWNEMRGRP